MAEAVEPSGKEGFTCPVNSAEQGRKTCRHPAHGHSVTQHRSMVSGLMCVASFGSAYGSSNRHHRRRCGLLFSSRLYRRCNRVLVRFFEEVRLASLTDDFALPILAPTLVRSFAATSTYHVEYVGAGILATPPRFRKAAEQGEAGAQRELGFAHEFGQGVPLDFTQAAVWYRKAAEQGDANAQYQLGRLYYSGQGVLQDYAQAALWWRKAAERGTATAQCNLGMMYAEGQGVPQDYTEAYFWLHMVAVSDYVPLREFAAKPLDEAALHLTPAELARVLERVLEWFKTHEAKPE
jgi:Sel1 repeat